MLLLLIAHFDLTSLTMSEVLVTRSYQIWRVCEPTVTAELYYCFDLSQILLC